MQKVSLCTATRPIQILLFLSGLYSPEGKDWKPSCYILAKMLGVVLTVVCLASMMISIAGHLLFLLAGSIAPIYLTSYALGGIYIVLTFRCLGQKRFTEFLEQFEAYQVIHCESLPNHKPVFLMGLVSLCCMLLCTGGAAYNASFPEILAECQIAFLGMPQGLFTVVCQPATNGVCVFFLVMTFCATFFLYLSVWRILKAEADSIVTNLEKQDRITLREKPEVIEAFRLRHSDLCRLITSANRFLRHILAAFYGSGLTCMLLSIYGVFGKQLDVVNLYGMGIIFFVFVLYLIVITLTGVSLNLKMHEPVDFLFCLDVQCMTGKGSEIVSAFLSRVQGAPIGFNVYNLFTVDTSTIMMICGTLLTYALVIIQFTPEATVNLCTSSSTDQPATEASSFRGNSTE